MRELSDLSRRERKALSALMTSAVASAGRPDLTFDLDALIAAAPVDLLPDAAVLHRSSGLIATGLAATGSLPADVRAELEAERNECGVHHLMILGTLRTIADAFDAAGLRWLVMKGPVLAGRLYEHPGDRSYGDIDLLIHHEDYPLAFDIFEEMGFTPTIHDWARAEAVMAGQINMAGPLVEVDVHWHLHYSAADRRPFRVNPTAFLERRVRADVGGITVPVLDPVDRILLLSFHAARSGGHRLIWLKDIERTLTLDRPDLAEVVERSKAMRIGPIVGMILDRSRRILDAPVASSIVDRLAPAALRTAERVALRLSGTAQTHDNDTAVRLLSRSVRPTLATAIIEAPSRAIRHVADSRYRLANETDDAGERASYFRAVTTSAEP